MTSENKSSTEPWIEKHQANYGYAYDPGGKTSSYFRVQGLPTAVLLDASGTVVWRGHPGNLTEADVEKALNGALKKPMWDWPKSASAVRKYLGKRQFAKALAATDKLGEDGSAIRSAIEGMVSGQLKAFEGMLEEGNYFDARELGTRMEKELAGLPAAQDVTASLKTLKADKQAQTILKAQKKVRSIGSGKIKKGKVDSIIRQLGKIRDAHPGTVAAKEADELIAALRERQR